MISLGKQLKTFLVSIFDFFSFFFFFLPYLPLARDSRKKWQEIINNPGLISIQNSCQTFSSLFFFFFFRIIIANWTGTAENFSSLFCFFFFSFEWFLRTGLEAAENFSSLFCFSFCFFLSLTYLLSRAG